MTTNDHRQTNGLEDPTAYYSQEFAFMSLKELAAAGGRITRVRWLKEGRNHDLSYVHGELPSGQTVHVWNPGFYLRPSWTLKRDLIDWAKEEGVYAKGIGLLDQANWSIAW